MKYELLRTRLPKQTKYLGTSTTSTYYLGKELDPRKLLDKKYDNYPCTMQNGNLSAYQIRK